MRVSGRTHAIAVTPRTESSSDGSLPRQVVSPCPFPAGQGTGWPPRWTRQTITVPAEILENDNACDRCRHSGLRRVPPVESRRRERASALQRCGAKLHPRRPNSIARTWALLISAMILYVPANLLPIMTVNMLGKGSPATIMGGVVTLIQADMFPIALVVFVASIVVPTFKLVGIALLLYSVQRHQPMSAASES